MDKSSDGHDITQDHSQGQNRHESYTPATFSIATPAITTILPMSEDMSDASFMQTSSSYQHDTSTEKSFRLQTQTQNLTGNQDQAGSLPGVSSETKSNTIVNHQDKSQQEHPSAELNSEDSRDQSSLDQKSNRKRNKLSKKTAKLDAKSKLEKSRQSARECRARKKLRYQYLEDLVCNREKAVIKLREELSMFCDLSKKVDEGNIDEASKKLLADQTTQGESTSFE